MNINCDELVISEVHFERNLDFEGTTDDLEISFEPEYGVSQEPQDRVSRLAVKFSAGEAGREDLPFYCNLQVVAVFTWDGWDEDEAEKAVMSQGMGIVMSFVRTKFYDLQKEAGLDPIMIPTMEFEV